MSREAGTRVLVHYTGTLDDGTQFDSSRERGPLEVILGQDMVIPGFEKAILGLEPGQSVTVTIPEEEAYGPHNEEKVIRIPREFFPAEIKPAVGGQFILRSPDGNETPALIIDMDDDEITLDANHPLAGFTLIFEIELVSVG
jgi:peptidylprolyl isomerase